MAIYTTFFLCKPEELSAGFPSWRLPLPKPIRREFKNMFTGEISTFETREPEWPDDENESVVSSEAVVIQGQGSYEDYLEGRLPPVVRDNAHWAAKGLTDVELSPLAEALTSEPKFEFPLYAPPTSGAVLQQLPEDMPSKLASLDQSGLEMVADRWAATMSTPEYTHSVSGVRINDDWKATEAMEILRPITAIARKATADQRMYLLIEA
jgi:hypothetical protein